MGDRDFNPDDGQGNANPGRVDAPEHGEAALRFIVRLWLSQQSCCCLGLD